MPGFAFPFLPRHLTLAAFLTIGIPSFVLALAPSDGPLYRGYLMRALAVFAVPAGIGIALGSIISFFLVDTVAGGTPRGGPDGGDDHPDRARARFRPSAGARPGREHIAVQGYMLVMVSAWAPPTPGSSPSPRCANSSKWSVLSSSQWFLRCSRPRSG